MSLVPPPDPSPLEPPASARAAVAPSRGALVAVAGGAAALGFVVALALAVRAPSLVLPSLPPASSSSLTSRPMPNVLVAVRELERLEGASYHLERVIDLREAQSRFFGLVTSEDALLLVAAADVTAGVDLGRLRPGDVSVGADRHVRVALPPAEIFATTLDNAHTYVHTRRTGALAVRNEGLETRARSEAEAELRAAALEAGLLGRAREHAARTVEALIRSLGYDEIDVTMADDGAASPSRVVPSTGP